MPANCVSASIRAGLRQAHLDAADALGVASVFWVQKNGKERLHVENGRTRFSAEDAERIANRLRGLNPNSTVVVR